MPRRALALLALLPLLGSPPAGADEMLADGIAAQVGTDIVLISEVLQMVAATERQMRDAGMDENEIAKLRAEGLEKMIEWRIIEKIVADAELYATDAEVDETIEAIASENGLTLEQLKASVTSHDLTYKSYREQIKRELERRKVLNAMVASRVKLDEADVRALYEERFSSQPAGGAQVHVRQILITSGEGTGRTRDVACTLAKEAYKRIQGGEPFEKVAREFSSVAPEHGGDVGWLHEDAMASWMAEAIEPIQSGETSGVIGLPFGCVIMQIVERREYTPISYEQAKPRLQSEAFDIKLAQEYRKWMEEMRERTYIDRRGYFADAARFDETPFAEYLDDEAEEGEEEGEESEFLIP